MTDKSDKNEGIQITGNIQAGAMAVGKGASAHQTVNNAPGGAQPSLDELVKQLKEALAQLPPEKQAEASAVEALTDDLVQTGTQEKPNPVLVEAKGAGLKAAAENLKAVAPVVVEIAARIVFQVLTMGR